MPAEHRGGQGQPRPVSASALCLLVEAPPCLGAIELNTYSFDFAGFFPLLGACVCFHIFKIFLDFLVPNV